MRLISHEGPLALHEATTRVSAELEAAGFSLVLDDAESDEAPFATVELRVEGSEVSADVTVEQVLHRVTVAVGMGGRGHRLLALRVVEVVRAAMLRVIDRKRRPEPGDAVIKPIAPPPAPEVETPSEATPTELTVPAGPVWSIAASAANTYTSGFGPTIGIALSVSRIGPSGFGARVLFVGPSFGESLGTADAFARVHQMFLWAELIYSRGERVGPLFALGLGAADTFATGVASPPLTGKTLHGFSFSAHASVGLHLRLASFLSAVLETGAALILPARPIQIEGTTVGNALPVSWLSTLGLVGNFGS